MHAEIQAQLFVYAKINTKKDHFLNLGQDVKLTIFYTASTNLSEY